MRLKSTPAWKKGLWVSVLWCDRLDISKELQVRAEKKAELRVTWYTFAPIAIILPSPTTTRQWEVGLACQKEEKKGNNCVFHTTKYNTFLFSLLLNVLVQMVQRSFPSFPLSASVRALPLHHPPGPLHVQCQGPRQRLFAQCGGP